MTDTTRKVYLSLVGTDVSTLVGILVGTNEGWVVGVLVGTEDGDALG